MDFIEKLKKVGYSEEIARQIYLFCMEFDSMNGLLELDERISEIEEKDNKGVLGMSYGYPNLDSQYTVVNNRMPQPEGIYTNQYPNTGIGQMPFSAFPNNQQIPNNNMTGMLPVQQQPVLPQTTPMRPNQNYLVRLVTGREEAVAAQIPLDGTVCVFVDIMHKRIYTKQLNMNDGSALFETYTKEVPQTETIESDVPKENSIQFVPIDIFDNFKQEVLSKFDELSKPTTQPEYKSSNKGGNK